MKLFATRLSIITVLISTLTPLPVFGHNLNQTEAAKKTHSMMLVQVAAYRSLVDSANREENLAFQASADFLAAFGQLMKASNNNQALKLTNVLIQTSGQASAHFQQSSEMGLKSLPYYAADPSAQTSLDTNYRLQSEMAQIFRGYNRLSKQTRNVFQANDTAKIKVLATKFAMLNEQRTKLNQMSQQISQAYKNRSNAANAQLINNLNTQMRNGIIQRGQATKCMVSNLPYGSSAQIANNAGAYCNSP